jgi:sugar phosphate isomerase/epimerase
VLSRTISGPGVERAWHNHDFEYRPLSDGSYPIDHLLDAGGPDVSFEADFAWVTRAGVDPGAAIKRHAEQIFAIQVKDTMAAGVTEEGGWAAMGEEIIDWSKLWPLFSTTRTDHVVVEHDDPNDWHETAKRSIQFLKSMKG